MDDSEQRKKKAQEFIQQLLLKSNGPEAFQEMIDEFKGRPAGERMAVATGLLAIGADQSEQKIRRNLALGQILFLVRLCNLQNDRKVQEKLSEVIEDWVPKQRKEVPLSHASYDSIPWGALLALGRINRSEGLAKCDYVIKFYGESKAARWVIELRDRIAMFNS